jgi:hypothetical protein
LVNLYMKSTTLFKMSPVRCRSKSPLSCCSSSAS